MSRSITSQASRRLVSVIASLVVLGFSSAAFGIPPEKINRDPFRFTGFAMAECPGFTVMWDGTIENTIINFFDKNGVMTRRHIHTAFTDSVFYNSSDPSYFVAGTPVNIQNDQLDFVNMIRMVSGLPVNITVPGYGVIWHWPGHVIINMLTGEVVFRSTADSARYNHDDLSALCAYLAQD